MLDLSSTKTRCGWRKTKYRQVTRPQVSGFRHILTLDCVATKFRRVCLSEDGKYRGCSGYVRLYTFLFRYFRLYVAECFSIVPNIAGAQCQFKSRGRTRGRWRLPGVVTSQRKSLSFSAMFVIMFIFWYSVFQLPSMWGVELIWRSERRNLLIAGLELRSFDFVIWSNWTEIAASMGFHRPQVVVFNYFRFFPINLLRNIMEECQNVRPYRYFADIHVGQRAS